MISALEFVFSLASGMRMHVVTSTSFDNRTIDVEAYLPGDQRKAMRSNSTHSFELSARRLLKRYRPELYEELKPHLFPLSPSERKHA